MSQENHPGVNDLRRDFLLEAEATEAAMNRLEESMSLQAPEDSGPRILIAGMGRIVKKCVLVNQGHKVTLSWPDGTRMTIAAPEGVELTVVEEIND